ncbi:HAD family hydrolase [Clostridium sp. Mt-5]|uniref:HAD family hydrolase n=1 Tax=Clostridium moutaii TaxID=3240932 RepID=A0ABV4BLN1_9CLOT
MISLDIPGHRSIEINNVVFDFNGTIAEDGILIKDIEDKIKKLSYKDVHIFIITSDTYGSAMKQCEGLPAEVNVFNEEDVSEYKGKIIEKIGCNSTVAIGNGRNDFEMFKKSILAIDVIGKEGCFAKGLSEADIVVNNIFDAIDLLLKPDRIRATLRT